MTKVSNEEQSNNANVLLGAVFNQKIRIVEPITRFKGRYSNENEMWLKENLGKTFKAYRSCINYYTLENGFYCHIYEASEVS
jgi:hypothetical protein